MSTLTEDPPCTFGVAELRFERLSLERRIGRRGDTIFFPPEWVQTEVYPIQDGEQFLLAEQERTFFGGTDEQPFVVELEPEHLERFRSGGETAFYSGLRPPNLVKYESLLGTKAVRQGDIWALSFGVSWEELKLNWDRSSGCRQTLGVVESSTKVFRTRHTLVGRRASRRTRVLTKTGFIGLRGITGDGVLSAPDHADLHLEGPHLLMQTPGILDPNRHGGILNGD